MAESINVFWWITAVELPVLAGLFGLFLKLKRDFFNDVEGMRKMCSSRHTIMRETLSAYKLEVARSYASIDALKETEKRLTSHLLRIEQKLDRTGGSNVR